MKKRTMAAILTVAIVTAMTGCGDTGAQTQTESATAATTEETSAEVAAENEWITDPTAYMSGITASDYVDLPADYVALTVEVEPAAEVTDEEVESTIDSQRQAKRELKEVTGRTKVQEGDIVNIDYVGRIDGEEFDGGSAEGYDLEIGSNTFIDGFESGLIDQKVGDTVTLEVTFPEDYGDSTKAGVDAEFEVTINSIPEYVVPELTNDFVTELGITDDFGNAVSTVDEYRIYKRNELVEKNEIQYTNNLEGAIVSAIFEKSVFKKDPPESMVERIYESLVLGLTNYAEQSGVDLLTYMTIKFHSTEDSYLQDIRNLAVQSVKEYIMLKAIGDKEGLSMSDEEFEIKLEQVASNIGITSVSDILKEDAEAYREEVDKRKVLDFLKSKTTVVSPASEEGATGATVAPAQAE